jgi:hypothetical protein
MSEGESLMMKTARAFLKETIRSARTLEFSLPIRRMPSLRTSAGPTFLGCLRRRTSLIVLPSQTRIKVLRRLEVFVF